jgi:hypothetical protein
MSENKDFEIALKRLQFVTDQYNAFPSGGEERENLHNIVIRLLTEYNFARTTRDYDAANHTVDQLNKKSKDKMNDDKKRALAVDLETWKTIQGSRTRAFKQEEEIMESLNNDPATEKWKKEHDDEARKADLSPVRQEGGGGKKRKYRKYRKSKKSKKRKYRKSRKSKKSKKRKH